MQMIALGDIDRHVPDRRSVAEHFLVRGQRTPRHLTREAIARLRYMQAKVLGVVLNGVDPGAPEYAYRYAYYFQDAAGA